ncbi:hypothetical protein [Actinomadura gamaensis]|uniref:Uncharacterized protein n=1 Tax=Actinomadura gamaensis TaxID=1763541 RepID=A0ABV9U7R6_9ACTN
MPLAALATPDDLTARHISFADRTLAETYLLVASASVRDAAGCPISLTTSTITLWADGGTWLQLPGGPVTAVTSVTVDGTALPADQWTLVGARLLRPCGWGPLCPGEPPVRVEVTYTHGLAVVPADVVDLVCRMAAAALTLAGAEPDGSGLALDRIVSERLGDYAVTYDRDSRTTEMELADRTRARLRSRFGGLAAAMVTAG